MGQLSHVPVWDESEPLGQEPGVIEKRPLHKMSEQEVQDLLFKKEVARVAKLPLEERLTHLLGLPTVDAIKILINLPVKIYNETAGPYAERLREHIDTEELASRYLVGTFVASSTMFALDILGPAFWGDKYYDSRIGGTAFATAAGAASLFSFLAASNTERTGTLVMSIIVGSVTGFLSLYTIYHVLAGKALPDVGHAAAPFVRLIGRKK